MFTVFTKGIYPNNEYDHSCVYYIYSRYIIILILNTIIRVFSHEYIHFQQTTKSTRANGPMLK